MKDRAVFCTCWEPNEFLDVWVRHYSRWFDAGTMFVCLIQKCKLPPLPVTTLDCTRPSGLYGHGYERAVRVSVASFLLKRHRVVVCADMDEMVFHEHKPLDQFLAEFADSGRPVARCRGVEPLDFGEGALDWSKPLLGQRTFCRPDRRYDKPCVVAKPTIWTPGTHEFVGMNPDMPCDDGLVLAHLSRIDLGAFKANIHRAKALTWETVDSGHSGWSTRHLLGDKMDAYYWSGLPDLNVIPAHWRGFA